MIERLENKGKTQKWEHQFSPEACLCFVNWLDGYEPTKECSDGERINPLSKKPNKPEYCISEQDY